VYISQRIKLILNPANTKSLYQMEIPRIIPIMHFKQIFIQLTLPYQIAFVTTKYLSKKFFVTLKLSICKGHIYVQVLHYPPYTILIISYVDRIPLTCPCNVISCSVSYFVNYTLQITRQSI